MQGCSPPQYCAANAVASAPALATRTIRGRRAVRVIAPDIGQPAVAGQGWRAPGPRGCAVDRRAAPTKMRRGASVAELVDAADSKSVARKGVLVRVRPEAPSSS